MRTSGLTSLSKQEKLTGRMPTFKVRAYTFLRCRDGE